MLWKLDLLSKQIEQVIRVNTQYIDEHHGKSDYFNGACSTFRITNGRLQYLQSELNRITKELQSGYLEEDVILDGMESEDIA